MSKAFFLLFRSAGVYGVVLTLAVLVRAYPNAAVTIAFLPARRLQLTCFHDSVVLNTLVAMSGCRTRRTLATGFPSQLTMFGLGLGLHLLACTHALCTSNIALRLHSRLTSGAGIFRPKEYADAYIE